MCEYGQFDKKKQQDFIELLNIKHASLLIMEFYEAKVSNSKKAFPPMCCTMQYSLQP